jgi:hypothetical protein
MNKNSYLQRVQAIGDVLIERVVPGLVVINAQ